MIVTTGQIPSRIRQVEVRFFRLLVPVPHGQNWFEVRMLFKRQQLVGGHGATLKTECYPTGI